MVAGTAVHIALDQTVAMGPQWSAGSVRVLGRVESLAKGIPLQSGPPTDHAQRRVVYLIANPGQDNEVFLSLLRRLEWLAEHRVEVGRRIHLDLHEMGIHGPATVLQITACPTKVQGHGSLVTGTFAHRSGQILWLHTDTESAPIGTTPTHPFWSVDRHDWVAAGKLQTGEALLTLSGPTAVTSISAGEEPVPVYNLEVEGDHVYRVGHSGVLVHNASCPTVWEHYDLDATRLAQLGGPEKVGCNVIGIRSGDNTRGWTHICLRHICAYLGNNPGTGCFCLPEADDNEILRRLELAIRMPQVVNAIMNAQHDVAVEVNIQNQKYRLVIEKTALDPSTGSLTPVPRCDVKTFFPLERFSSARGTCECPQCCGGDCP